MQTYGISAGRDFQISDFRIIDSPEIFNLYVPSPYRSPDNLPANWLPYFFLVSMQISNISYGLGEIEYTLLFAPGRDYTFNEELVKRPSLMANFEESPTPQEVLRYLADPTQTHYTYDVELIDQWLQDWFHDYYS